jgi:hypothetical protein
MRKVNGATAVAAEQQALAIVNDRIGEISRLREQQLLSGDENAIDALEGELELLERVAKRHGDRIKALGVQAALEEAAAVAKRKAALIERIVKKLVVSVGDAGKEVERLVGELDAAFQKLVLLREECAAAWPFDTVALTACCLTGASIRTALQHEIFRHARPFVGGGEFASPVVSLPGGVPSDIVTRRPDLVDPLSDVLRRANDHAIAIMRGATTALPEPLAPSPAEEHRPNA